MNSDADGDVALVRPLMSRDDVLQGCCCQCRLFRSWERSDRGVLEDFELASSHSLHDVAGQALVLADQRIEDR